MSACCQAAADSDGFAHDHSTITPGCEFGPHAPDAHPCGKPVRVGDPCQFCGDPTGADEQGRPVPCPKCWVSLDGKSLADLKALFALGDMSVSPAPEGPA